MNVVSTAYEESGRTRQKQRTRGDLIANLRGLLNQLQSPAAATFTGGGGGAAGGASLKPPVPDAAADPEP